MPAATTNEIVHQKMILPPDYQPSPIDVLCGKGKACFLNPANKLLRNHIETSLATYANATSKAQKTLIVNEIVAKVRSHHPSGATKFVRKDNSSGRWYEIGDQAAREKVGHSIRETLILRNREKPTKQRKYKGGAKKSKQRQEASRRSPTPMQYRSVSAPTSPSAPPAPTPTPPRTPPPPSSDNPLLHLKPINPDHLKFEDIDFLGLFTAEKEVGLRVSSSHDPKKVTPASTGSLSHWFGAPFPDLQGRDQPLQQQETPDDLSLLLSISSASPLDGKFNFFESSDSATTDDDSHDASDDFPIIMTPL